MTRAFVFRLLSLVLLAGQPAMAAQDVSFGDDSGEYSNDGECDDPRFDGPGMTATYLFSADMLADASDCKAAWDAGDLTLRGVAADGTIDFGDDRGDYTHDGECDDMRFTGPAMTATDLIQEDIMHDANDCKSAYVAGRLKLRLD